MPDLREIGLDPAVQGVPVKKKRSVLHFRAPNQKKTHIVDPTFKVLLPPPVFLRLINEDYFTNTYNI